MKAPELKTFPTDAGKQDFTKTVEASNQQSTKPKAKAKKAPKVEKATPKSYSLTNDDQAYINGHALKLSNEQGKSVGASEALRDIINAHRGTK